MGEGGRVNLPASAGCRVFMSFFVAPEPSELSGDSHFMALALQEAAKGVGRTAPNPPVGCVIVQDSAIVGRGFHPRAGEPHAEVFALREAGSSAQGASAYVTLEPCSHTGRTPPCADALIRAGIRRVIIAASDPNPKVNGQGVQKLQDAGIAVTVGVLEAHALYQQAGFRSAMQRARPWLIYKYAMTLDGKIAAHGEANGAVTSSAANEQVMRWRNQVDGIAVGVGTVLLDNPRLTVRGIEGGRDARAILFDRQLRSPLSAHAVREGTIILTQSHDDVKINAFVAQGVSVLQAKTLQAGLEQLAQQHIHTLVLEGGATLASAFFADNLIDEVRCFIAPKLLGAGLAPLIQPEQSMQHAQTLHHLHHEYYGDDSLLRGLTAASLLEPLKGGK